MKKLLLLILLFGFSEAYSQINNPYGLQVINEHADYKKSVREDKNKQLIEIKKSIPDIKLDIRYAGKNNFAKQAVYKQARAFARLPVVEALKNVQNELKKSGFGLKIFDGYRPYSVTVKFFAIASDKSFVANPKDGSRHNRGCAIDLTLIDLKTGKELKMPTPYDSFAAEAASDFMDLPANVIENRELLRNTMEKHGFRVLNNEWWHFDFIGWKNYELMDIPFEDL
ncbi:M15 family metallopeptidase [Daejeonella sp.]|uniref:M15 family metallopeptidase n=1 Tax=Daejeonella sp. TaxID=2805397 RepID=UPI00271A5FC9|nr:M15 family metallopeptidase [Daejeonella sp.]MDO8991881.1 M15 family metallopeptidase [Daejeonella sp.]MDP2413968.1 M15 family metallopeptidase [Daejeonella sp.]